jgi:hypothetical protein
VMDALQSNWERPVMEAGLVCVTLLAIVGGIHATPVAWLRFPYEDLDGATAFLRQNVQPSDIIWVHASTGEGFKLYARMTGWKDAPAKFGNVSWPCCPRDVTNIVGTNTVSDVRNDMSAGVPKGFSGTVWLLYTRRVDHWKYAGLDEPQTMKSFLTERGCSEKPTPSFFNIQVDSFKCGKRSNVQ